MTRETGMCCRELRVERWVGEAEEREKAEEKGEERGEAKKRD